MCSTAMRVGQHDTRWTTSWQAISIELQNMESVALHCVFNTVMAGPVCQGGLGLGLGLRARPS